MQRSVLHVAGRRATALIVASAIALTSCSGSADGPATKARKADRPATEAKKAEVPDGWTLHTDQRGFELRLPPGWSVEVKDDLLITARSTGGNVVAVAPFIAPPVTRPEDCVRNAPETFPSLFPQGQLVAVRPGGREGEAVGSVTYAGGGRASLLCALDGRAGMLYAIAAPAPVFDARRSELVRILESFSFNGAGGSRTRAEANISYKTFKDPNESAFTVEVPEGWKVSGGAIRRSAVEVSPRVEVRSPDGGIHVFIGDDDLRTHVLPNSMLAAGGFAEGSEYSPGYGVSFLVRRHASGHEYANDHAQRRLGCQGYTPTGGGDRPDLAGKLGSIYRQQGFVTMKLDVGDVTFRCSNSLAHGYVFAGTLSTGSGGMGIWSVQYLYGYRAGAESGGQAKEILKHMVSSFRLDPRWVQSQQQLTGDVSKIVTDANAQISETISSGYESRQSTLDSIYRKWSNATLGQTDVRDPSTGEEFRVESGHNYYWRKTGSSKVAGENLGERPDVDFEPLKEF